MTASTLRLDPAAFTTDREEYLASPDFWREHIHPADAQRVLGEFARLMQAGRLTYEYRFRKKDGAYCWISDELLLLRDAAGNPVEVVGAWSDVTRPLAISPRPSSARTSRTCWATNRASIWKARTSGEIASTRTTLPPWKPSPCSCSGKASTRFNTAS